MLFLVSCNWCSMRRHLYRCIYCDLKNEACHLDVSWLVTTQYSNQIIFLLFSITFSFYTLYTTWKQFQNALNQVHIFCNMLLLLCNFWFFLISCNLLYVPHFVSEALYVNNNNSNNSCLVVHQLRYKYSFVIGFNTLSISLQIFERSTDCVLCSFRLQLNCDVLVNSDVWCV